ncbi:MAG: hypothetical protein GWN23_03740, partial [Gemmatimonadetes bacterium]|nr:hypothetical protein [Gemmatimonadota bacterium]
GAAFALGLVAFVFHALLTQGLRLFDNDYDWINAARAGGLDILADILRPVPERWGFQDRPVQILLFKALFSLSGHGPAAYYLFKAFLVALLAVALAFFARGAGLGARAGLLAGAVVAAASPTFASALWVSDFELLAQLLTVAFLGAFLAFDRIDPSRLPAWTARF